jgi:hypothetical protein
MLSVCSRAWHHRAVHTLVLAGATPRLDPEHHTYDMPLEDPHACKREWLSPGTWAGDPPPDYKTGTELWGTKWGQRFIYDHQAGMDFLRIPVLISSIIRTKHNGSSKFFC